MPLDLTRFALTEMLRCSSEVRRVARGAATLEATARQICHYLYEDSFSRVPIAPAVADRFRTIPLDVKTAFFAFGEDRVFDTHGRAG